MTKQRLRDFLDGMGRGEKEIRNSALKLKNDIAEVETQKEITDYKKYDRDNECTYRNSCELPSCLGCRQLK
jgi:hypothetical protein